MGAPQSVQEKAIGLEQQSAFGTAIADTVAVRQLHVDLATIDWNVDFLEDRQASAVRHGIATDVDSSNDGALPSIPLGGHLKKLDGAEMLYGFFQKVTEVGTSPYGKTFTLPVASPHQPDFESDAGYFATIWDKRATASDSEKIIDAIARNLGFEIDQRGRLRFSSEWVGRGAPITNANPTGTWTPSANDFFRYSRISASTINTGSGDTTYRIKKFSISLAQTVEPIGYDATTGNFETFGIFDKQLSFDLVVSRDSNAGALATARTNATLITVKIGWGNATPGTDDGDLHFTFTGKIQEYKDDNENYLGVQISGPILGADSSTSPITVVLADDDLKSW